MYNLLMHYFPATSILEGQENIFEDAMKKGPKTFLVSKVYYKPYPLELGRNNENADCEIYREHE